MGFNRIVHIGFPKTASSFLQINVFSNCKDYTYVDFLTSKTLANKIVLDGFGLEVEQIQKELPEGNIIFSYEGLCGGLFTGQGINSSTTTVNLKKIGFNKVIIVLRKDRDKWIRSIHNQFVKGGGRLTYADFLGNPTNVFQMRQWYPELFDFAPVLIKEYCREFGDKNVIVFYSEDIYGDVDTFKLQLQNFMETSVEVGNKKVNESIPQWVVRILLFTNHFTSSQLNPTSIFKWITIGHMKKLLLGRNRSFHKS